MVVGWWGGGGADINPFTSRLLPVGKHYVRFSFFRNGSSCCSPPVSMPPALFHLFLFVSSFSFPPSLRSSNIRPGQFGYGRVPFSLPLHRPNRQARHTVNGTAAATPVPPPAAVEDRAAPEGREEEREQANEGVRSEEEEPTQAPPAETTPAPGPQRRVDRPPLRPEPGRARAPPSHTFSRSSSASLQPGRHRFDWHSVTAPPPPAPPLPRLNSHASSRFSTSLHRPGPVQVERDPHPGFSPQVPPLSSVYPLQHPHTPHGGGEPGRDGGRGAPQSYRCPGLDKEHRRCLAQVTPSGEPTNCPSERVRCFALTCCCC